MVSPPRIVFETTAGRGWFPRLEMAVKQRLEWGWCPRRKLTMRQRLEWGWCPRRKLTMRQRLEWGWCPRRELLRDNGWNGDGFPAVNNYKTTSGMGMVSPPQII
jgi:hypothetical protein